MHRPVSNHDSQPVVSVIMIFLNAEAFIAEAIKSVINQRFERWELLLVDDGSSDASTTIALGFAERWPDHVRYLEHPDRENRGMSASRNLGLRHARGEYIAFLDADDIWFPYTLEEQVAAMRAHPEAGMVLGATEYWYSWTGKLEDHQRDACDFRDVSGIRFNTLLRPPQYLVGFLRNTALLAGICSTIASRRIIDSVGGFETQFRSLHEDQAFLAKMALHCPIYITDQCWARYRQHPNSTCAIAVQNNVVGAANAFFVNWLGAYLRKQNVNDPSVWSALTEYC